MTHPTPAQVEVAEASLATGGAVFSVEDGRLLVAVPATALAAILEGDLATSTFSVMRASDGQTVCFFELRPIPL